MVFKHSTDEVCLASKSSWCCCFQPCLLGNLSFSECPLLRNITGRQHPFVRGRIEWQRKCFVAIDVTTTSAASVWPGQPVIFVGLDCSPILIIRDCVPYGLCALGPGLWVLLLGGKGEEWSIVRGWLSHRQRRTSKASSKFSFWAHVAAVVAVVICILAGSQWEASEGLSNWLWAAKPGKDLCICMSRVVVVRCSPLLLHVACCCWCCCCSCCCCCCCCCQYCCFACCLASPGSRVSVSATCQPAWSALGSERLVFSPSNRICPLYPQSAPVNCKGWPTPRPEMNIKMCCNLQYIPIAHK